MPELLVPTNDAIDRLLGALRKRLEDALRNGQRVSVRASAGMKQFVWQPGVDVVPEEDGSFSLSIQIEKRNA